MPNAAGPAPTRAASTRIPHVARIRRVADLKPSLEVDGIRERLKSIRRAGGDPSMYLELLERKILDEERRLDRRYRPWRQCRRSV